MLIPATVAAYLDIDQVDEQKLAMLEREAVAIIKAYAPHLPEVEVWTEPAQVVLLRVVARGYSNPDTGTTSTQVTAGPFQLSQSTRSSGLYLSKADKRILDNTGKPGGIHAIILLDTDYIYTKGPQPDLWEQ